MIHHLGTALKKMSDDPDVIIAVAGALFAREDIPLVEAEPERCNQAGATCTPILQIIKENVR